MFFLNFILFYCILSLTVEILDDTHHHVWICCANIALRFRPLSLLRVFSLSRLCIWSSSIPLRLSHGTASNSPPAPPHLGLTPVLLTPFISPRPTPFLHSPSTTKSQRLLFSLPLRSPPLRSLMFTFNFCLCYEMLKTPGRGRTFIHTQTA